MDWVRAGIANRCKNVQPFKLRNARKHGSDRGLVTGLASVVSFFHSTSGSEPVGRGLVRADVTWFLTRRSDPWALPTRA